jgi:hypothetical protein
MKAAENQDSQYKTDIPSINSPQTNTSKVSNNILNNFFNIKNFSCPSNAQTKLNPSSSSPITNSNNESNKRSRSVINSPNNSNNSIYSDATKKAKNASSPTETYIDLESNLSDSYEEEFLTKDLCTINKSIEIQSSNKLKSSRFTRKITTVHFKK